MCEEIVTGLFFSAKFPSSNLFASLRGFKKLVQLEASHEGRKVYILVMLNRV